MAGRKTVFEARASLIDRLVDLHPKSPGEARPLRSLSREMLRQSVRRDLEWLLNTRTPIPAKLFDKRELTVIDYGIPDFGGYSPENPDDQALMVRRIQRSLAAFEPRLREVRVTIDHEMADEKTLNVKIQARLVSDSVSEPVSFQTVFQRQTGIWEVHESTQ